MSLSIADQLDQISAQRKNRARWVAGCGGSEVPFTKNGYRLLYVWNGLSGQDCEHAYLNLDTDTILSHADERALNLR